MMTAEVKYKGDLRTIVTHCKSGSDILTDAPTDNQGKGEAFSPTDLVAAALGSCMLTIMGIRAREANFDIEGAEVSVKKVMANKPRRISELIVKITLPRKYDPEIQALLEKTAFNNPVIRSIHPDISVMIDFE